MKSNIKAISASVLLLSPISFAMAAQSPCDATRMKDAIHCAYLAQTTQGKYIKVKEIQKGRPATTMVYCAAPTAQPLMSIPQSQWGAYQPGDSITWQYSQCVDEDCSSSKVLLDDKFTISKSGKLYTSGPNKFVAVALDSNYGVSCKTDAVDTKRVAGLKKQVNDSSLQMRIDDATAMLQAVPVMLNNTTSVLVQMVAIATEVATGTYSQDQMTQMDKQFQTLKAEMDKVQRVNTLDGYKKLSNGSMSIQIGYSSYMSDASVLNIPIPATDQESLAVSYLDVQSQDDAQYAIVNLNYAMSVVTNAMSLKK